MYEPLLDSARQRPLGSAIGIPVAFAGAPLHSEGRRDAWDMMSI